MKNENNETHEIMDDNVIIVVGVLFYLLQMYVYINSKNNGC